MKILRQSKVVRRVSGRTFCCNCCPRNNSLALHPVCLPSSLLKFELLVFPVLLQPQPALISFPRLTFLPLIWPLPFSDTCSDTLTDLRCFFVLILPMESSVPFLESYLFLMPLDTGDFQSCFPLVPQSLDRETNSLPE